MNYFIEWILSLNFCLMIGFKEFRVEILSLVFFIQFSNMKYSLSLGLPKYALAVTNCDNFFYKLSEYHFYRKKIFKGLTLYVLHVVGENVKTVNYQP